jgi:tetratricopeptide (TPR) repeat protein
LAKGLVKEMSRLGNARVIAPARNDASSGSLPKSKIQARTVLSSSKRTIDTGTTLSIQLADSNGNLLLHKSFSLNAATSRTELPEGLARGVYSILAMNDWSNLINAKADAGLRNQNARELIAAGRELGFHHTVIDFDRARSCFEKALAIEPRSAVAHAYLASAAAARTHYINDPNLLAYAEREIDEALRLAPDSGETLRVLAGVDYRRGQLRKALQTAFRAVETSTPNAMSFALLGMIHNELGSPDRALHWFELARNCEGNRGEYDNELGDCRAALGDDERARNDYQRASDLHPERSEGWIGLARLFLLRGDFAAARNIVRKNASNHQESIDRAQIAAQIEFFARNFPEAQRLYARLSKTDPDGGGNFYGNVGYESALGRIAIAEGNVPEGIAILRSCLDKEREHLAQVPDNPNVLYRVSAMESSLGEDESALRHLSAATAAGWLDYRSLSLDPRFDSIASDTRFQLLLGQLKLKTDGLRRTSQN